MRTIFIIIFLALYIIVHLPHLVYFKIVGKTDPDRVERLARKCVSNVFRIMCRMAGVTLTVSGIGNVPDDIPVLFVGNHRSFFDIFITYPLNKGKTSYVAQDGLRKIPCIGLWGDAMGCLFFNRNDMKQALKMVINGIAYLKKDTSVFVFPEGTRNKGKSELPLLPFKDGTFKMAAKSGRPVIPVALKGTRDIWEAHYPWARPAAVSVKYGKPIYINELSEDDRKHPAAYFEKVIEKMLME